MVARSVTRPMQNIYDFTRNSVVHERIRASQMRVESADRCPLMRMRFVRQKIAGLAVMSTVDVDGMSVWENGGGECLRS